MQLTTLEKQVSPISFHGTSCPTSRETLEALTHTCASAGIPSIFPPYIHSIDGTFSTDNIYTRDHANYSATQEVAIVNFFEEGNDEAVNVTYGVSPYPWVIPI
jgi:predicted acylesterase/phospholipase RssA